MLNGTQNIKRIQHACHTVIELIFSLEHGHGQENSHVSKCLLTAMIKTIGLPTDVCNLNKICAVINQILYDLRLLACVKNNVLERDLQLAQGMCPGSSSGRAPAHKAADLGSNPGPCANFFLNILT